MHESELRLLTGLTLAVGVSTWVFSPIKFQADMGLLLGFMFLWNMLGALLLLPALAHWLLRPAAAQPALRDTAPEPVTRIPTTTRESQHHHDQLHHRGAPQA